MADWFIVHIASGNEERAKRYCTLYRIPAYCPMMRELRLVPRRDLSKKQRALGVPLARPHLTPLFPRYMFVELDDPFFARSAFAQAGIEGLMSSNGESGLRPYRFPKEAIAKMKSKEEGDPPAIPGDTPADLIFKVGEEIRITEGALAWRVARIAAIPGVAIEAIDSNTRLSVAVAAFGRVLDVELTVGQVTKLAP